MNTFILSGSMRSVSQTRKVANFLQHHITQSLSGTVTRLLDLGQEPLPLWSEKNKEDANFKQSWQSIKMSLEAADSLILLSPEWNGMATPAVLNFLLLCDKISLAHKPVLLIGVSEGRGGGTVIHELRAFGYKNTFFNPIPEHLIFHDVGDLVNDFDLTTGSKNDLYIKNRSLYSLKLLGEYSKALQKVRESGVFDPIRYPNGMS
jgi:NAD(P)H-dependent FMN reductase